MRKKLDIYSILEYNKHIRLRQEPQKKQKGDD
nr:MAG TPA: hypothetical protein [Caudoviricetes sp.]